IESNRGGPRCVPSTSRDSGAIGFDGCVSFVPLELGTDVLSQLRIYLATKEQRVYITRAVPVPAAGAVPGATGQSAPAPAANGAVAPGAAGSGAAAAAGQAAAPAR